MVSNLMGNIFGSQNKVAPQRQAKLNGHYYLIEYNELIERAAAEKNQIKMMSIRQAQQHKHAHTIKQNLLATKPGTGLISIVDHNQIPNDFQVIEEDEDDEELL